MSNRKVSELPVTSASLASDYLIINQNSQTKKISVANLFSVPVPVNIGNMLRFGATPDIVKAGAASIEIPVTHIDLTGTNTVTLSNGVEGQVKVLVATIGTGGVTTLGGNFYNTIQLNSIGDTATLMFTGGKWAIIGGTAAVV